MLRHHSTLALGLAAVFVLPASLPGGQEPMDLEERLEATVAALEHLGGIERRIHAGDRGVLAELLNVTETPMLDAQSRDESLVLLRSEVAALQERWDELSLGASPFTPGAQPLPLPTDGGQPLAGPTHVGLDTTAHADIHDQVRARANGDEGETTRPDALRTYEQTEGYSADSLRQGRLLARAERWDEALTLLAPHDADPEVRFWIARCYEGLGRDGEAIEVLRALVAAGQPDAETGAEAPADARALARRAGYDLKFLELRRELGDRRDAKESGQ